MEYIYRLINKKLLLSEVYASTVFDNVLHEYLSSIDDEIKTLLRYGVKLNEGDLNFDHMMIVKQDVSDRVKKFPIVLDVIKLNLSNFMLESLDNLPLTTSKNQCNKIIDSIRNNMNLLIGNRGHNSHSGHSGHSCHSDHNGLKSSRSLKYSRHHKDNRDSKVLEKKDKFIKSVVNNSKPVSSKRLIPSVRDSDDEVSDDEENCDKKNDLEPCVDYGSDSDLELTDEPPDTRTPFNTKVTRVDDDLDVNTEDLSNLDPDELKRRMDYLKSLKEKEVNRLEEIKTRHEKDVKNLSTYFNKLNEKKRGYRREKERFEENKRKFSADKTVYQKIKQHILEGKVNENNIPEMFRDKYPIFKFMDEKSLLDIDNDFELYVGLYNSLYEDKNKDKETGQTYVPHNINYLSPEEQEKYKTVRENYKDDIEEFIAGKNNTKNYPSLQEILDDISDSESEDSDENKIPDVENNFEEVSSDNQRLLCNR